MPASRQRALELLRMHQATACFDQLKGGYVVTYWKGFTCRRAKTLIPTRIIEALTRDGLAEEQRKPSPKNPDTEIVFVQITQAGRIGNSPVATKRSVDVRLPYVD